MSIQLLNASLRNDKTVMKDSVNLVFQKHYAHVGVLLLSCFHKTITRLAMATPSSQCDLEERRKKWSQTYDADLSRKSDSAKSLKSANHKAQVLGLIKIMGTQEHM